MISWVPVATIDDVDGVNFAVWAPTPQRQRVRFNSGRAAHPCASNIPRGCWSCCPGWAKALYKYQFAIMRRDCEKVGPLAFPPRSRRDRSKVPTWPLHWHDAEWISRRRQTNC